MRTRAISTALFAFSLLMLCHYQNCTATGGAGSLQFGSSSTTCPAGETLNANGSCSTGSTSTLSVTIASPDGTSSLALSSQVIVTGSCTLAASPQITITLTNPSSQQQVVSTTTYCTTGGLGSYSATLPQNYSGQVVPSAGNYTLNVSANSGQLTAIASPQVVLTFKAGLGVPTITGWSGGALTQANPQAIEESFANPNAIDNVDLSGTCDSINTYRLQINKFGAGPVAQVALNGQSGPNPVVGNYNGVCSAGTFGGVSSSAKFQDLTAPGVAGQGGEWYTFNYQVVAFAGSSASQGASYSNNVTVYIRPLPKDINYDDTLLLMRALASKLGYQSAFIELTGSGFNPIPQEGAAADPAQVIYARLSNFGGNYTYGLFDAACDMVKTYGSGNPTGTTATPLVLSAFGISSMSQYNAANNPIWDYVKANNPGYLMPQVQTSGSILSLPPPAGCP